MLFDGPAFRGLDAKTFNAKQQKFAHKHLRILSGLYGVLCAMDKSKSLQIELKAGIGLGLGLGLGLN